jgi:hypothetical protein
LEEFLHDAVSVKPPFPILTTHATRIRTCHTPDFMLEIKLAFMSFIALTFSRPPFRRGSLDDTTIPRRSALSNSAFQSPFLLAISVDLLPTTHTAYFPLVMATLRRLLPHETRRIKMQRCNLT